MVFRLRYTAGSGPFQLSGSTQASAKKKQKFQLFEFVVIQMYPLFLVKFAGPPFAN